LRGLPHCAFGGARARTAGGRARQGASVSHVVPGELGHRNRASATASPTVTPRLVPRTSPGLSQGVPRARRLPGRRWLTLARCPSGPRLEPDFEGAEVPLEPPLQPGLFARVEERLAGW